MKANHDDAGISPREKALLVVLLSASIGLTGCEQEGSAEKAGRKIDQVTEKAAQKIDQAAESAGKKLEGTKEALGEQADRAGGYMDDSAITAKIKAEFLGDPLLKVSEVSVTTTNGVVSLSGVVDSQHSVDRALELVRSKTKAKSVENHLVVKGPERP